MIHDFKPLVLPEIEEFKEFRVKLNNNFNEYKLKYEQLNSQYSTLSTVLSSTTKELNTTEMNTKEIITEEMTTKEVNTKEKELQERIEYEQEYSLKLEKIINLYEKMFNLYVTDYNENEFKLKKKKFEFLLRQEQNKFKYIPLQKKTGFLGQEFEFENEMLPKFIENLNKN